MSEELRHIILHSLGLCGEGHPSLLALVGYATICLHWIRSKLRR